MTRPRCLSPSTQEIDRNIKFEDYAAHGVDEYWIVDAQQKTIEQYLLTAGVFQLAFKKNDGALREALTDHGGLGSDMNTMSPRETADVTVDLKPGYYLLYCFKPDVNKNGDPHVVEGMMGHCAVS